ncbi:MAG: glycoside hydrolase family 25 protein [Candidatus Vecturithrix sp.]|nr:glycoside hydrolase family 25 protein [Candidatus Vecturithrix sp.]
MKQVLLSHILLVMFMLNLVSCSGPTDPGDGPVEGLTLPGIDISHHNIDGYTMIDWAQVRRAGYVFAFVKATDGYKGGWTDPTFRANMEQGHQAGMFMGAYHYARPDLNPNARVEAAYFVNVARPFLIAGYLRPVLDLETGASLGKATLSNWAHVWMATVKQLTGIEPIFYTYSNFTRYLDSSVTQYDFWLAHYTRDPAIAPNPGLWDDWDFWQYTDSGSVPGVSDPTIDLDLFNGGLARLQEEFVIH